MKNPGSRSRFSNLEMALLLARMNPSSDTRPCTQCQREVPKTQMLLTCEKCRESQKRKKQRRKERRLAGTIGDGAGTGSATLNATIRVAMDEYDREQIENPCLTRRAKPTPGGSGALLAGLDEIDLGKNRIESSGNKGKGKSDVKGKEQTTKTSKMEMGEGCTLVTECPADVEKKGTGTKRKFDDSEFAMGEDRVSVCKRLKADLSGRSKMAYLGHPIPTPTPELEVKNQSLFPSVATQTSIKPKTTMPRTVVQAAPSLSEPTSQIETTVGCRPQPMPALLNHGAPSASAILDASTTESSTLANVPVANASNPTKFRIADRTNAVATNVNNDTKSKEKPEIKQGTLSNWVTSIPRPEVVKKPPPEIAPSPGLASFRAKFAFAHPG